MNEFDDLDELERELGPGLRLALCAIAEQIQADEPTPAGGPDTDGSASPDTLPTRRPIVTLVDTEPNPSAQETHHRWPIIAVAAAAVVAIVVGALAARNDSDDQIPTGPLTTVDPETAAHAEAVVTGFLDAWRALNADRALTYLTDDAIVAMARRGSGADTREEFGLLTRLLEAIGYQETITGCEPRGESAVGVSLRCAFQFHAVRSEEIGLGPYPDNSWEFTVRDGKIVSAEWTWEVRSNGFSDQMWEPFVAWLVARHDQDVPVMFESGNWRVSEDSIRLWGTRTGEYVSQVRSERGRERLVALEAGVGLIGLPADGARASTPEHGELIHEFYLSLGEVGGPPVGGIARLYVDGRLIWRLFINISSTGPADSTGWVEQRLSPGEVERVADHVELGPDWATMPALTFLGMLPPGTWDEPRPYVPSGYAACLRLDDGEFNTIEAPTQQLLAMLPEPAAELLTGRPTPPGPDMGWSACLALSIENARSLDRALSDAGLEQDAQTNRLMLQYQLDYPREDGAVLQIEFEPLFPDGSMSCSGCG